MCAGAAAWDGQGRAGAQPCVKPCFVTVWETASRVTTACIRVQAQRVKACIALTLRVLQVQLHGTGKAEQARTLVTVWETASGVTTAQAACEMELSKLTWHKGSGLPECICLAKVRELSYLERAAYCAGADRSPVLAHNVLAG